MSKGGVIVMTNQRQVGAVREGIRKSHEARRNVPRREPTRALPNGYQREVARAKVNEEFFRIELRPKHRYSTLRTDEILRPGGVQLVVGRRPNGHWADQELLIPKQVAHIHNGHLIGDTKPVRELIKSLGSTPVQLTADRFRAKPHHESGEQEE